MSDNTRDWVGGAGDAAATRGIQRAAEHAGEPWRLQALNLARVYSRSHKYFMATELRQWAEQSEGLRTPPDPRAWGAVLRDLSAEGAVQPYGYGKNPLVQAHSRPSMIWRSMVTGE